MKGFHFGPMAHFRTLFGPISKPKKSIQEYQIKFLIETNPISTIGQFNEKNRRVKREITIGSAERNGKFYRENDSRGTIHSDLKKSVGLG